jgi:hypothetical protein
MGELELWFQSRFLILISGRKKLGTGYFFLGLGFFLLFFATVTQDIWFICRI